MKIEVRKVSLQDEDIVQKIFEAAPTYFRRVDGVEVEKHFAKREMSDEAKKKSPTYEKVFCILYLDGKPIGVADWHKDHPEKGTAYLGLLLVVDDQHGKGIGRAAYVAAEQFVISELNAVKIKLGVSERNHVQGYWEKMGFIPNGETYIWKGEKVESTVIEMEKLLDFHLK